MHERTGRAVARLLFVFCCALPTLTTMGVIAATWTPWYHARCLAELEQTLSLETGLVVEIDDFSRLDPSRMRLDGVRVLEPEMRREVARVRVLWWVSQNDRVAIHLEQPELQSAQLPYAWQLVHDRFLCRPNRTQAPVGFSADDLTIHSRTGPLTLRDVDAWIRPLAESVEATVQCLPASSRADAAPFGISVIRDRSGEAPSTAWTLRTGDTALPCSVLAEYLPLMQRLGSDAMFAGLLRWTLDRENWSVDLGGSQFTQVDLSQLTERLPHRLTGKADVQLERCRIQQGRASDISGQLRATSGHLGASLLGRARDHLGFDLFVDPSALRDVWYDLMAVRFDLQGQSLKLDGICRTERGYEGLPAHIAITADGLPLAASADNTMQAVQLGQALAPEHSVSMPLADQTRFLLDFLPAPSRPLPSGDSIPLAPRISAAGRWQGDSPIIQP